MFSLLRRKICSSDQIRWINLIFLFLYIALPVEAVIGQERAGLVPSVGHSQSVSSVAILPDGEHLVSASEDGTVQIWEITSGRLIRSHPKNGGVARSVIAFPTGERVAVGYGDGTLRIWDLRTVDAAGVSIKAHDDEISSLAMSSMNDLLLSGSWDGSVKLWSVTDGALVQTFRRSGAEPITSVSFAQSDDKVAAADDGGNVWLWSARSGEALGLLRHPSAVNGVALSDDGNLAVTSSQDGSVRIWDLRTHTITTTLEHGPGLTAVSFGFGTEQVFSAGEHDAILWNVANKQRLHAFRRSGDSNEEWVSSLLVPRHGTTLIVGYRDGAIVRWNADTGHALKTYKSAVEIVSSVAVSSDGLLIASGSADSVIRLWHASNGTFIRSLEGHSARVRSVDFFPNAELLVSGDESGEIRLWRVGDGSLVKAISGHQAAVRAVRFTPDGKFIASGSLDGTIKIWDLATDHNSKTLNGHADGVTGISVSPDNKTIYSSSLDKTVKIWNIGSGDLLKTINYRDELLSVAFVSSRHFLAAGTGNEILLWDVANDELLRTYRAHEAPVTSLTVASNGESFVSASWDGTIRVWNLADDRPMATFSGHLGRVNSVALLRRDRIVSGGGDGTVRLWDTGSTLSTRAGLLATLMGRGKEQWLAITPAGFFAASDGGGGNTAHVVRGLKAYSVMQFFDALYRPELLRELLDHDVEGRYKDAASKLNLDSILDSGPAPKIELLQKRTDAAGSSVQLSVRIFHSFGRGIGPRLVWRLNWTPIGETEPSELRDARQSSGPIVVAQGIKIDPSRANVVTVTAYNGTGQLATEPLEILIDKSGVSQDGERSRMFIIAIGVNDYSSPRLPALKYPVDDVKKLASALREVAIAGGYDRPVSTFELVQENATLEKIERAFSSVATEARQQDTLIVILAGHGESVAGRYFYYPSDTQLDDRHTVETEGIGVETWARLIASVQVEKKLVIIDTCKSYDGIAVIRGGDVERIVQEATANRIQNAVGQSVFTASREAALEGKALGHGVLTYALLKTLAEPQASSEIDVKLLDRLVEPEVRRLSRLLNKEQQFYSKVGGNFILGTTPSGYPPPTFSPVSTRSGRYVICSQIEIRSKPSTTEGDRVENLNESGIGCTEVQVVDFYNGWTAVAKDGIAKGYVPAASVQHLR